jgi:quercetin dioxygenase-like cupin family protein
MLPLSPEPMRSSTGNSIESVEQPWRYPDHRHPPEEIYIAMSRGEWRQASNPWHEPGIGNLVYNPPNIVHAMRSADQPLLAVWFLWTAPTNA